MRKMLPLISIVAVVAVLSLSRDVSAQSLSLKLLSLTSPVERGANATIKIQTVARAACTIRVTYYDSGTSKAAGLGPKTADAKGMVSWTWRVGNNVMPAPAPVDVTCSAGGHSGLLQTVFRVQ